METPKPPCRKCDYRYKDKNKEPCDSCPLPLAYDEALKQHHFPTYKFLTTAIKNNWGVKKPKPKTKPIDRKKKDVGLKAWKQKTYGLKKKEKRKMEENHIDTTTDESQSQENLTDSGQGRDRLIEGYIEQICRDHGITVEELKTKTRGRPTAKVIEVRSEIIEALLSGKFGKLTKTEISVFLNIRERAIRSRSQTKRKIKAVDSPLIDKPEADDIIIPIDIVEDPKKVDPPKSLNLRIDFSNHAEIYKELITLAEENLRTLENQVLWIFMKIHATGMKEFNEKLS